MTSPATIGSVEEYPHIRRVGAYLFFAWLAFWSALPVYALGRTWELPRDLTGLAGSLVAFATFFTLRDMTSRRNHLLASERGS